MYQELVIFPQNKLVDCSIITARYNAEVTAPVFEIAEHR